ncbi:MAG: helix-turn-helix domain-containing protein [Chloroflexi bacterium]|nr:helix-turn-helix domain-containing protein [Chloroflexota bacterium]
MGRKSLYQPDYHPVKGRELAGKGLIDEEICESFGINHDTFYQWQKRYPAFADAIKQGKKKPNRDVEAALLKRALGYKTRETHVVPSGKKGEKAKVVKMVEREEPGNVTAAIFWVKNRMPKRWRDTLHVKGQITGGFTIEQLHKRAEDLKRQREEKDAGKRGH